MYKRIVLTICICIVSSLPAAGQDYFLPGEKPVLPRMGVKSNLLYDATGTVNLSGEVRLWQHYTLDVSFNLNGWTYGEDKKFKHLLLQPEMRYWVYEPFNGHFFGSHLMWGHYNVGNITLPFRQLRGLKNQRYEGDLYGIGLSYGYQWLLTKRLSLEATFGFGYLYLNHSVYECGHCGAFREKRHKQYVGPTKLGLSLIYIIK